MRRARLLSVGLAVAIGLAGCGGSDDSPDSTAAPEDATTTSAEATEPPAEGAGGCAEAFAAAEPEGDAVAPLEALHATFTACTSYQEWVTASEDFDYQVGNPGAEPVPVNDGRGGVARTMCRFALGQFGTPMSPELAETPVCQSPEIPK